MDRSDRKAAAAAYREQKASAGVCAIRCAVDDRTWLVDSLTVDTCRNRLWFELRQGAHRDRSLQAAWTAHGEAAFDFEIVARLPADTSPLLLRTELKALLAACRAREA